MCEPVTLLTAATTGLSIAGQASAHAQGKRIAKAQRAAAVAEYEANMRSLNTRGQQETEAAAEDKLRQQREYRAAKASAIIAAEDAGVMGISADALLADLAAQQAERQKATDTNLGWVLAQLRQEQRGAANTMASRMNTARDPALAPLLISIGGTAIEGINKWRTRHEQRQSAQT